MADLMTTQQVADLLGVHYRTVHRMAARGELPHEHKIDGHSGAWLFSPKVVELVAKQRASKP